MSIQRSNLWAAFVLVPTTSTGQVTTKVRRHGFEQTGAELEH